MVRLIRVRFPDLCDHVLPLKAPMEIAALLAREEAIKKTGLPKRADRDFLPLPLRRQGDGRAGAHRHPPAPTWTACCAISDVYPRLVSAMNHLDKVEPLARSGIIGVSWASIGGEAAGLLNENHLAADGIENVIQVLEELEDEKLQELDFIELNACAGGCVGGHIRRRERLCGPRAGSSGCANTCRFPATAPRTRRARSGWNGPTGWSSRRS